MKAIRIISVAVFILAVCATPSSYSGTEPASKWTTEAEIVKQMGWEVRGGFGNQTFPSVSSPTEEVNARTYKDADESLATYKTFDFDYTNEINALLEKELFRRIYIGERPRFLMQTNLVSLKEIKTYVGGKH
ncbi:MAG: hypothetical protein ABII75_05800 [Candidatus Omnitrophota bacterium]